MAVAGFSRPSRLDMLKRTRSFKDLAPEVFEALMASATTHEVEAGQTLFRTGDSFGEVVYILYAGHMRQRWQSGDVRGRPALGMFNQLVATSRNASGAHIDLKRNGLRLIADATRTLALNKGIGVQNTTDRLSALVRAGIFTESFSAPVVSLLHRWRSGFPWSARRQLHDPRLQAMHACLHACKPGSLLRTPLAHTRFVVVDTETTGFHAYAGDAIVSIALIELQGLAPTGQVFTSLVNPRRDIPPISTSVHHITEADVAEAPSIEEVLCDVIPFIGDSILIGHHVQFDLRFLDKTLYQLCRGRLRHPCLDAMMLYTAASGRLGYYTLEEVARECRVTIRGRHTAYGDAMAAAAIFLSPGTALESGRAAGVTADSVPARGGAISSHVIVFNHSEGNLERSNEL